MQVDILKEENGNKYLISVNENKKILKRSIEFCDGIKSEIKAINGGKELVTEKDYMQIKLNSDVDFSLNKLLKFHGMTITVRSVFEKDNKLYPQVFLEDCLYEL